MSRPQFFECYVQSSDIDPRLGNPPHWQSFWLDLSRMVGYTYTCSQVDSQAAVAVVMDSGKTFTLRMRLEEFQTKLDALISFRFAKRRRQVIS